MKDELLKCTIEAAILAGNILKEGYGSSFDIHNKSGVNNLVTTYDFLAEKAIIEYITGKFPESRFLAEESGSTGAEEHDKLLWIIDPLDGTVNFAHALPIFSVSIAAQLHGEIVCGAIYHPLADELFTALSGGGAWLNGKPISISDNDDFKKSFLVTGFPYNVMKNPEYIELFVSIIREGIPVRRLGSAALDLAYVACGRFDGFWEIDLNPWDVAAGILLVREAGGLVTEFDKNDYSIFDRQLLATNGKIHNEISELLMKTMPKVEHLKK
ncbi:MAG: inositol monophosphatase [Ignavibacteria bacterium]|nr:inositol monophosphatase [Ignavibacteria bacterium]